MSAAPLYKREDIVYRLSGAEIGRLEAFRISSARQRSAGVWEYEVIIHDRPPEQPTMGDRVQPKIKESRLYFFEAELVSLCEALNIIVARLDTQINNVENYLMSVDTTNVQSETVDGAPKFNIGDRVWIKNSAKIGFFEDDIVVGVQEVGIQPGSKKPRFTYSLRKTSNRPNFNLYFREDELITKIEAAELVLVSLERQYNQMSEMQASRCVS